jgi:uncharacterized protein (DUF2267 family)
MNEAEMTAEPDDLLATLLTRRLTETLGEGLAHEVYNPLNCALLQLAVLQRRLEQPDCQPESLRPVAALVERALRRLERLFRELVSRLEAGTADSGGPLAAGGSTNVFEDVTAETTVWLRAVMWEGGGIDARTSLQAMSVGLPAVRAQLTAEEAAHLGAHLPVLVRGMFFGAPARSTDGAASRAALLGMLDRHRSAAAATATNADIASLLFRVVQRQMRLPDARSRPGND